MRGATPLSLIPLFSLTFQPTRPLRGATQFFFTDSTHFLFQPTRPLRGATKKMTVSGLPSKISTHAPLAGRDIEVLRRRGYMVHFNPRAPCGARQGRPQRVTGTFPISTHAPLAGRDFDDSCIVDELPISTHAPLAGRDWTKRDISLIRSYFNPRAPCGARRVSPLCVWRWTTGFQPTRPLRGATKR